LTEHTTAAVTTMAPRAHAWDASRVRLGAFTSCVAAGHAALATLAFAGGFSVAGARAAFGVLLRRDPFTGGGGADALVLASYATAALVAAVGAVCCCAPLAVYAHTQRRHLRTVLGAAFSTACALALALVVASPASPTSTWLGAVLLFSAAAGEAFLADALLARVHGWAATDAAAKLGVPVAADDGAAAFGDAAGADAAEAAAAAAAADAAQRAKSRASMRRLLSLSAPDARYVVFGFGALVLAAAAQTLIPGLIGKTIDAVTAEDDGSGGGGAAAAVRTQMLLLVGASLGTAVFTGCRGWAFSIALARLRVRLRDRLFRSLLVQEQAFFDASPTGELMSRLSADSVAVGDQVSLNVNVFLRSAIAAVGSFAFMLSLSWRLTALALCTIPPTVLVSRSYGNLVRRLSKLAQRRLAEANKAAEEALGSIATVRAFGAERREADRHADAMADYYDLNARQAGYYGGYAVVTTALPSLVTALVLYVGGLLVQAGSLTSGTLVSFLLYQLNVAAAIGSMGDIFSGLMTVRRVCGARRQRQGMGLDASAAAINSFSPRRNSLSNAPSTAGTGVGRQAL
jgi:hypothetical protein